MAPYNFSMYGSLRTICNIITGLELLKDQITCFAEANDKATFLLNKPGIYMAKPACQILPTTVKEKEVNI